MRKWIVIALTGVVVIGVVTYVLSQPKKGSLEWHKRGYLKARAGGWMGFSYRDSRARQIDFHRQALRERGYTINRDFIVSNRAGDDVTLAVWEKVKLSKEFPFVDFMWIETNVVRITAPPEAMDRVGALIRTLDVPGNAR